MKSYLSLTYEHDEALPSDEHGEIRTPEPLVERFLREYTNPGDSVLDPFAGYGTTLAVAERLDREPHGIEYEPDRVDYIGERLDRPECIRQGDILEFDVTSLPACACCFTSPPFMERTDDRNPFRNYCGESSYEQYLDDIERGFARVDPALAPGGHVVLDIVNMKYQNRVTPLAWDVADRLSSVFHFEGEVVIGWEGDDEGDGVYGYGYDHSYCLVFTSE